MEANINHTLNCNGQLIKLDSPKIMGILNTTPDSFFDGGMHNTITKALKKTETLLEQGATFVDIGGYSTRPNAEHITIDEEIKRTQPLIKVILKEFPEALISIDTFRSEVANEALQAGAALVNDISAGLLDNNMLQTVATHKVPFIVMHHRGSIETMHNSWNYDNISNDVLTFFSERIQAANQLGLSDVILDPGFGFSKSTEQNFDLFKQLELLKLAGKPILVGISRKSMIYKTLKTNPENALNGTTALHGIALLKGANILRVHDVKEATECITLIEQLG